VAIDNRTIEPARLDRWMFRHIGV